MTETYNISREPVDYQDGMAQKMTELRGTFDAAKADWNKLFGEAPKSIDDIDVIGLHDKKTGKKREFVPIDRVLEIVDDADKKAGDKTYIVLDDGSFYSQVKYIKEKMLELLEEGGEG